jgi:hypothetical protein
MSITPDRVGEIFRGLESGDGAAFVARLFAGNPID